MSTLLEAMALAVARPYRYRSFRGAFFLSAEDQRIAGFTCGEQGEELRGVDCAIAPRGDGVLAYASEGKSIQKKLGCTSCGEKW